MYTIVQFSPTGNTAYIAKQLAYHLDVHKIHALEHTKVANLEKNDHLIILFAIHAFNAPKTVKRFIKQLPVGLYKHVSLLAVGCSDIWINSAVTKDIRKILNNKGYPVIVDRVLAMPLTFIMSFPEALIAEQIKTANNELIKISQSIKMLTANERDIPVKSHVVNFLGRAEPFAARMFGLELHATKKCTKCGLCVKECPEKNIEFNKDDKVVFGFKCMMCMRCIYNCPTQAITPYISKFIPAKHGYSIENHIDKEV